MQHNQVNKLASLRRVLTGPQVIAFLPAICLCTYWFGGEAALAVAALLIPMLLLALSFEGRAPRQTEATDGITGLPMRDTLIKSLDDIIGARGTTGRTTACLVLEIDNMAAVSSSFGVDTADKLTKLIALRLQDTMREFDTVAWLESARFGIGLAPVRHADLESLIQLASRIQSSLNEPFSVDTTKIYASSSIGFCMPSRAPSQSGDAFLTAAESALNDAIHNGPGSIRAFARDRTVQASQRPVEADDVGFALENGQIVPWFQPQVSTDTGEVTGAEALARWEHPEQGIIPPSKFLSILDDLGQTERLGEIIRFHAFSALREWEKQGTVIPAISVNFTSAELSNPKLVDKLRWELDRHDLTPDRLDVEILENVIATTNDDIIPRNIRALKDMGCSIDLDDYGTGYASISNIRRFAVDRIKIDRSYVTRCDSDREQQDMLAAILTMAERLNLETLAEGVETLGEHAMLAQLGCGFVQGYSVSHPLRAPQVIQWVTEHNKKLEATPRIGRRTG